MNICKRALTIALRHPLYLIIYIGFLSSMGVVLMGEVGGSGAREATEVPRARIALVDRDGSAVAQSLEEMLFQTDELITVADEPLALQDALATGKADAVLVIPAGFGDALMDAARTGGDLPELEAATGGDILVKNVTPKHLESITAKLMEMGVTVIEYDDAVRVRRDTPLRKCNVKTMPHPGFPTDMQPQMTTALCLAEGTSIITEGIWGSRYRYTEELTRMGANIHVDGAIAVVEGVRELNGAPVRAHDLRAGAAMVIAGLAAKGVTEVEQVQNIERGYETLGEKFVALGADMYLSLIHI